MTPLLWFEYAVATAGGLLVIGLVVLLFVGILGWANRGKA